MSKELIEKIADAIGALRFAVSNDSNRHFAQAALRAIEASGTHRVVPIDPDTKRWHVVCDWDTRVEKDGTPYEWRGERPAREDTVWTVSRAPDWTGWETDNGQTGYGLTYEEAKELADAANAFAADRANE